MRQRSFQKYEEIWLLRRSYSSPDLYIEHFVVRHSIFNPCPIGFKLLDITTRDDWIPSLETKKDRSKSSSERTRGRNNRHCRRPSDWTRGRNNRRCRGRCTYRVYLNEYDSGSMNLNITLHTKSLLASSFFKESVSLSFGNILSTSPILTTWEQRVKMQIL